MVVDAQYAGFWALLPAAARRELEELGLDFRTAFAAEIYRAQGHALALLGSGALHSGAVGDPLGLRATVRALATGESGGGGAEGAAGLQALRKCWDVVDEAQAGAAFFGWLAAAVEAAAAACAVGSVALALTCDGGGGGGIEFFPFALTEGGGGGSGPPAAVQLALLCLSGLCALCGAAEAWLGAGARGRQLADLAAGLESAVWQYRARTGEYAAREAGRTEKRELLLENKAELAEERLVGLRLPWPLRGWRGGTATGRSRRTGRSRGG